VSRQLVHTPRNNIICGRRNCSRCGRWRLVIDFRATRRNENGEVVILNSWCNHCHREESRSRAKLPKTKRRIATDRSNKRAHYRRKHGKGVLDGRSKPRTPTFRQNVSVDRLPFARWLKQRIDRYGIGYVEQMTKMPQREISRIVNGYDKSGHHRKRDGKRKFRAIDYVELHTVDEALLNWGAGPDELDTLYPSSEGALQ
jgi:hypothetical protein